MGRREDNLKLVVLRSRQSDILTSLSSLYCYMDSLISDYFEMKTSIREDGLWPSILKAFSWHLKSSVSCKMHMKDKKLDSWRATPSRYMRNKTSEQRILYVGFHSKRPMHVFIPATTALHSHHQHSASLHLSAENSWQNIILTQHR